MLASTTQRFCTGVDKDAGGPADNLRPSPCDSGQSIRTLISPGLIILKTDATQLKKSIKEEKQFLRLKIISNNANAPNTNPFILNVGRMTSIKFSLE